MLQPKLNGSVAVILKLIKGEELHQDASFTWIHVKDVAYAHILAFEVPSAYGRYCLVVSVAHHSEITKLLRELDPTLVIPAKSAEDKPIILTYQVSTEEAESLGIKYVPLKESLKGKGFLSLKSQFGVCRII